MSFELTEDNKTRTGGRAATDGVIPGRYALSVGKPNSTPPTGWTWTPLSSIARLETGHTPSRKHPEYWGGEVSWIGIRDATGNHGSTIYETQQYTNDLGIANSSARILPANTVCLSRTASVGYVVVMGVPMATSQDFVNWVCSDDLDYRFLKYILLAEHDSLLRFASGTTHQTIYFPEAKAFHVCIPDLKTQKATADILQALDDRIALLRETNATLEAIAQALFKSWFVDFDPVHAKQQGRIPEGAVQGSTSAAQGKMPLAALDEATVSLFPDSFEESELGLVPKGWQIGTLGDLLSLRNERTKPSAQTASLPYVPIENITAKSPFLQDYKSGEEANSSLILFRKGDVLFGAMRPYFHKVCSAPFDGVTRTTVFTLTSRNPKASGFALFQAYQDTTIDYATQHSEGSTIPYAKWPKSLENMAIVLPSSNLQERFSEVVSVFVECANENLQQAQTLATLRDTLLPRLISGQLRLPEAEAMVEQI